MQFENGFEVDAPVDTTWQTLMDLERVAPAVPGAEVLEKTGDNAYKVGIKVKLGPMTMNYRGDLEIAERDDAAHQAVMKIKAREARGQGTADAEARMKLDGDEQHTKATLTTDVRLSGRAAAMSRGIVQDVSAKLVQTFADNLAAMLTEPTPETDATVAPPPEAAAPPPQPPPSPRPQQDALDVGDLAGGVLASRLRDPRTLAVLLTLVALAGWLIGRRRG
jgi:carbon monoxide dehydrogenase subunit G